MTLLFEPAAADIIDIALVAFFIYLVLIFIKETRLFFIFTTLIVISTVSYLAELFELRASKALFGPILTFFLLIIIIVFQREIRRFFEWFAIRGRRIALRRHISESAEVRHSVLEATAELVNRKQGAIIVFEGDHPLEHSIEGAAKLDGRVSLPVLLSLFDPRTPGHDGAVIIKGSRIAYFGAHLPLAHNLKHLERTGTRHRAAVGITEETDALSIIVSEETGNVSAALNGRLERVGREECARMIRQFFESRTARAEKKINWKDFLVRNWSLKVASILLAVLVRLLLEI